MNTSSTVGPENDTSAGSASGSSAGLAMGLTLFFLLLVIVAGVIVYKYHSKIRNVLQFGHRRSQKKEDYKETPAADSHQYTYRQQSIGQTPIYENLATQTKQHTVNQSRSSAEPEEDLYLQCDLPDDAIYGNDPACNPPILSVYQDDDVYIMPDS